MASGGEVEANHEKVVERGLTFPIVLQKRREGSREQAMFATPVPYLIDDEGVIAAEVATGAQPILDLLSRAVIPAQAAVRERRRGCDKLPGECGCGHRKAVPRRVQGTVRSSRAANGIRPEERKR